MQLKKTAIPMILAGVFAGPVGAQAPIEDINDPGRRAEGSNASMQAELYRQLQQLRQEVMSLRGTVEQQGHQLRQLKQQSLDRYLDVDRRLSAMSGAAPSSPLGSSSDDPAAMASAEGETTAVDSAVATSPSTGVSPAASASPAVASESDDASSSEAAATLTGNPSQDYAQAYALVKARDYDQAIEAFKSYIQRYPDDRYTPNAWYWLGELYAVGERNLEASAQAFQKLLTDYPNNGKVPAAMYKLGTVYFLQGEKQKAQQMLTNVLDRYGNTGNSAVKKSREFLRDNF